MSLSGVRPGTVGLYPLLRPCYLPEACRGPEWFDFVEPVCHSGVHVPYQGQFDLELEANSGTRNTSLQFDAVTSALEQDAGNGARLTPRIVLSTRTSPLISYLVVKWKA